MCSESSLQVSLDKAHKTHQCIFNSYRPLYEASQEATGGIAKWNMCRPRLSDVLDTASNQRRHFVYEHYLDVCQEVYYAVMRILTHAYSALVCLPLSLMSLC